jgi:hypothetical protein
MFRLNSEIDLKAVINDMVEHAFSTNFGFWRVGIGAKFFMGRKKNLLP